MTSLSPTDYPDFSGAPAANSVYVFFGTPTTGDTLGPYYVGQSSALYMQANFDGANPDELAIFFHADSDPGSDIFGFSGYTAQTPLVIADMITPLGPYMFIKALTIGGPVHDLGQLVLYTAARPESSLSPSGSPFLLPQTSETCLAGDHAEVRMNASVVGAAQVVAQVNTGASTLTFTVRDTAADSTVTNLAAKTVADTDGIVAFPVFLANSVPDIDVYNPGGSDADFTLLVMTIRGLT